jgi:hypothetical protein
MRTEYILCLGPQYKRLLQTPPEFAVLEKQCAWTSSCEANVRSPFDHGFLSEPLPKPTVVWIAGAVLVKQQMVSSGTACIALSGQMTSMAPSNYLRSAAGTIASPLPDPVVSIVLRTGRKK